jgi:regulatory protein
MNDLKKTITAIKAGKNSKAQRSNIYLDKKFAFSLDNEVIFKEKLKVGQPITLQQIERLNGSDNYQRCLNAALQFLSVRPRSQSETSQRLAKRGFSQPEIELTIEKLKNLNLLNDTAFAEYWKENRTAFRPRSQRVLKLELRQKGVESEVVNAAVSQIDEAANAYRAAAIKARTLPTADYQVFRKRLGGFLLRRGFGYGVIKNTVKQMWQEKTGIAVTQLDQDEETGTFQD